MHVLKFGGTSMDDEITWRRVLDIINHFDRPFVIVSATARTTRQLLTAAETALDNYTEAKKQLTAIRQRHQQLIANFLDNTPTQKSVIRSNCQQWIDQKCDNLDRLFRQIQTDQTLTLELKDTIASMGERLSSYLFAQCGQAYGLPTVWLDATEFIRTDSDFGQASPDIHYINNKAPEKFQNIDDQAIPIMGGYYGADAHGNVTTLGFEGSDYTASLMGSALNAEAIEIWTDVSGIYTCDPRVVPEARPIPELSFQQATELAYFGAKVLHPSTTKPASQKNIPIFVKNIFEPQEPGTRIATNVSSNGRAKAITFKKEALILTISSAQTVMGYEFLAHIFEALEKHRLAVDVVTTTEASVSIAVENHASIPTLKKELRTLGTVESVGRQGIISLVGCNTTQTQHLVADILEGIGQETISLISFSRSKRNLNVVMDQQKITAAVKAIHRKIFTYD